MVTSTPGEASKAFGVKGCQARRKGCQAMIAHVRLIPGRVWGVDGMNMIFGWLAAVFRQPLADELLHLPASWQGSGRQGWPFLADGLLHLPASWQGSGSECQFALFTLACGDLGGDASDTSLA